MQMAHQLQSQSKERKKVTKSASSSHVVSPLPPGSSTTTSSSSNAYSTNPYSPAYPVDQKEQHNTANTAMSTGAASSASTNNLFQPKFSNTNNYNYNSYMTYSNPVVITGSTGTTTIINSPPQSFSATSQHPPSHGHSHSLNSYQPTAQYPQPQQITVSNQFPYFPVDQQESLQQQQQQHEQLVQFSQLQSAQIQPNLGQSSHQWQATAAATNSPNVQDQQSQQQQQLYQRQQLISAQQSSVKPNAALAKFKDLFGSKRLSDGTAMNGGTTITAAVLGAGTTTTTSNTKQFLESSNYAGNSSANFNKSSRAIAQIQVNKIQQQQQQQQQQSQQLPMYPQIDGISTISKNLLASPKRPKENSSQGTTAQDDDKKRKNIQIQSQQQQQYQSFQHSQQTAVTNGRNDIPPVESSSSGRSIDMETLAEYKKQLQIQLESVNSCLHTYNNNTRAPNTNSISNSTKYNNNIQTNNKNNPSASNIPNNPAPLSSNYQQNQIDKPNKNSTQKMSHNLAANPKLSKLTINIDAPPAHHPNIHQDDNSSSNNNTELFSKKISLDEIAMISAPQSVRNTKDSTHTHGNNNINPINNLHHSSSKNPYSIVSSTAQGQQNRYGLPHYSPSNTAQLNDKDGYNVQWQQQQQQQQPYNSSYLNKNPQDIGKITGQQQQQYSSPSSIVMRNSIPSGPTAASPSSQGYFDISLGLPNNPQNGIQSKQYPKTTTNTTKDVQNPLNPSNNNINNPQNFFLSTKAQQTKSSVKKLNLDNTLLMQQQRNNSNNNNQAGTQNNFPSTIPSPNSNGQTLSNSNFMHQSNYTSKACSPPATDNQPQSILAMQLSHLKTRVANVLKNLSTANTTNIQLNMQLLEKIQQLQLKGYNQQDNQVESLENTMTNQINQSNYQKHDQYQVKISQQQSTIKGMNSQGQLASTTPLTLTLSGMGNQQQLVQQNQGQQQQFQQTGHSNHNKSNSLQLSRSQDRQELAFGTVAAGGAGADKIVNINNTKNNSNQVNQGYFNQQQQQSYGQQDQQKQQQQQQQQQQISQPFFFGQRTNSSDIKQIHNSSNYQENHQLNHHHQSNSINGFPSNNNNNNNKNTWASNQVAVQTKSLLLLQSPASLASTAHSNQQDQNQQAPPNAATGSSISTKNYSSNSNNGFPCKQLCNFPQKSKNNGNTMIPSSTTTSASKQTTSYFPGSAASTIGQKNAKNTGFFS